MTTGITPVTVLFLAKEIPEELNCEGKEKGRVYTKHKYPRKNWYLVAKNLGNRLAGFVTTLSASHSSFTQRLQSDRTHLEKVSLVPKELTLVFCMDATPSDASAMYLLLSNVDLNMIRSWLGHASIEKTQHLCRIDLEMKRKTLQSCEKLLPKKARLGPSWQRNNDILMVVGVVMCSRRV